MSELKLIVKPKNIWNNCIRQRSLTALFFTSFFKLLWIWTLSRVQGFHTYVFLETKLLKCSHACVCVHQASSSEDLGRWLGVLFAETGSATLPDELHYDYIDVDTLTDIRHAARHSFLWVTSDSLSAPALTQSFLSLITIFNPDMLWFPVFYYLLFFFLLVGGPPPLLLLPAAPQQTQEPMMRSMKVLRWGNVTYLLILLSLASGIFQNLIK